MGRWSYWKKNVQMAGGVVYKEFVRCAYNVTWSRIGKEAGEKTGVKRFVQRENVLEP